MDLTDAIALLALVAMEVVLGIDNIAFISVVTARLPEAQQRQARNIGLGLAMFLRIALLLTITWIIGLKSAAFTLTGLGIPANWMPKESHIYQQAPETTSPALTKEEKPASDQDEKDVGHPVNKDINEVTWKDIILLLGGLFLIRSSVKEIHHKVEGVHEEGPEPVKASFSSVIGQILMLDLIFSLDSVITAVGMVSPDKIWIMITSVVIAVIVMMAFAGYVARFVERHPTVKMLALSFLLLIGVMLVADALGTHIDKGYIYFAMAFSLGVEVLNLRASSKAARRKAAEAGKPVPAKH
jgi:predicted tellurium resistance membrane protein TerC